MLEELRRKVSQWVARDAPETPAYPLLFADHEEIRDIARQMSRTKVELDRSVLALRSWARELNRRLDESPAPLGRTLHLRTLGVTAPRWRDEAERRGVLIAVTQELAAIPPVEGNGFELRDALVQLILNAVTAMPYGGTLGIRAASEESGWVVLEVSDTGVGMPEEIRRRVGDRALGPPPGGHAGRGRAGAAATIGRDGGGARRGRAGRPGGPAP